MTQTQKDLIRTACSITAYLVVGAFALAAALLITGGVVMLAAGITGAI